MRQRLDINITRGVQNFTGTDRRRKNRTVFGADRKSRGQRAKVMDISNAGAVMQSELISKNRILTEPTCYIYIYIYILDSLIFWYI